MNKVLTPPELYSRMAVPLREVFRQINRNSRNSSGEFGCCTLFPFHGLTGRTRSLWKYHWKCRKILKLIQIRFPSHSNTK